jgi:hypothetical protein
VVEVTFFQFLKQALSAIEREVPVAYEKLCSKVFDTPLRISVDGETRRLLVQGRRLALAPDGPSAAELITRREVLSDLLQARCSLIEACFSDDLLLRGAPDDVILLHEALEAFVQGAVRCVALPALLDVYLGNEQASGRPTTISGLDMEQSSEGIVDG